MKPWLAHCLRRICIAKAKSMLGIISPSKFMNEWAKDNCVLWSIEELIGELLRIIDKGINR